MKRWLAVLGALLAFNAAGAARSTVVIGIEGYDNREPESWDAFEEYLAERPRGLDVEFRGMAFSAIVEGLQEGRVQGAILSPYRYVILAAHANDLVDLVARIQRGGTYRGSEAFESEKLKPRTHYHSLLLARTNSDDWPLRNVGGDGVKLGVRDQRSTSSFLYPADFLLSELQRLRGTRLAARELLHVEDVSGAKVDLARALDLFDPQVSGDMGDLTERLRSNADLKFVGMSSHQWESLAADTHLREVWRSPPIPFDPVVLSRGLDDAQRQAISRALLSTRNLTGPERDQIFSPRCRPASDLEGPIRVDAEEQVCERVPDIHAFVEANDQDYDGIRRVAVRLAGGVELRLALAGSAHPSWDRDEDYFRRVKSALLTPGKQEDPIFLDYDAPGDATFEALGRAVRRGDYDLAELNAHEAGRLVFEGAGAVLARSRYGDERLAGQSAQLDGDFATSRTIRFAYRLVMLAVGGTGDVKEVLEGPGLIAIPTENTSSAYRYARYFFDESRGTPIDSGRFCQVDGARGVVRALLDYADGLEGPTSQVATCDRDRVATRFAILPEFDWIRERNQLLGRGITVVTDDQLEVPNAMLVMSTRFAPLDEDLRMRWPPWLSKARRVVASGAHEPSSEEIEQRRRAVRRLRGALEDETLARENRLRDEEEDRRDPLGFVGMAPADKAVAVTISRVHEKFAPNRLGLALGSLVLLVAGTALVVWKAGRGDGRRRLVTEPIHFGGDRQIQAFIRQAVHTRSRLYERRTLPTLAEALGGTEDVHKAISELDSKIFPVLAFYGPEAQVVDAEAYFGALSALAGALQEILTRISDYEREHRMGVWGDPQLEIQGREAAESKLIQDTLSVALEISKVLTGKG